MIKIDETKLNGLSGNSKKNMQISQEILMFFHFIQAGCSLVKQ
jgi:hypothetical protein